MNKISASNKDNIIVWNEDDEVYSVIANAPTGKTATTNASATTATTIKVGWSQAADGTWSFVKADGTKATAWYQYGTTWYYLKANGVMQTGWINDNGTWYYCNGSGAMLANTTIDGYVLVANGAWAK